MRLRIVMRHHTMAGCAHRVVSSNEVHKVGAGIANVRTGATAQHGRGREENTVGRQRWLRHATKGAEGGRLCYDNKQRTILAARRAEARANSATSCARGAGGWLLDVRPK